MKASTRIVTDVPIDLDDPVVDLMPSDRVLCVGDRGDTPVLWVATLADGRLVPREFVVLDHTYPDETGHGQTVGHYVGTYHPRGHRPRHVFAPPNAHQTGAKVATTIYLSTDQRDRLAAIGGELSVSMASIIRGAIDVELEKLEAGLESE